MMAVVFPIVVIVVLILLNGLFVAAEFAIVASKAPRVQQDAEKGSGVAQRILTLLRSATGKDRYIAVCQLGITLASILLGMYGEKTIASWLYGPLEHTFRFSHALAHTFGTLISLALITYMHVVFGEMIPKAFALQRPESTVYGVDLAIRIFGFVFRPVIFVLNSTALFLLRALKIKDTGSGDRLYTSEELEFLVEESAEGGQFDRQDQQFIESIFDFGERWVNEVMTPRTEIRALTIRATAEELEQLIHEGTYSRFLVVDTYLDQPLGYIHIKDAIRAFSVSPQDIRISHILRPVIVFPDSTRLSDALVMMKKRKTHLAVVEDELGGTAGIITLQDIIEEVLAPDDRDEAEGREPGVEG
ncbi:hemolysin family protein [Deinococcus cellulosilyticus]|uniref:Hemolysin n=1 Tax=Deinococcus cellulosilyticus (strain DSM 18568 / NBRC 106333 / KACC 11606 / 5516J-15) TaxID=1223518 RepID=A0A511N2T7_DEIC1|nr:hemolysin family protein [Deinococcus cellulosilyticus]GEM47153.1 hemolysin [Deinococcus cellulosilyticus NBRC 106333 = KACC 11606]